MRALLLAAGKATRLGELSRTTPKCLHEIEGEALLDRLVRQLRDAGVEQFVVNTHHLADQIEAHVARRSDRDDFILVREPELLGTLGTLRAVAGVFQEEPGWVLHADNFLVGRLTPLRACFEARPATCWGSMLTFPTTDPASCGIVETDDNHVVTGFYEKDPQARGNQASAATYIFDPRVFSLVRRLPLDASDISRDLIGLLVGRLNTTSEIDRVIDIGTPEGLRAARTQSLGESS